MSVELVRKNSDVPNIQNYEDARMVRYAFGATTGIVKNYGNEVIVTQKSANVVTVGTGEIVHQGWQVEITGNGYDVELTEGASDYYYTIYLEISLAISASQVATIGIASALNDYPVISPGDDLTEVNDGTSRVAIAKVRKLSGVVTIEATLSVIDYQETINADIYARLDAMGFNEGSFYSFSAGAAHQSPLGPANTIIKTGLLARANLIVDLYINIPAYQSYTWTAKVPSGFLPDYTQSTYVRVTMQTGSLTMYLCLEASLSDDTLTVVFNSATGDRRLLEIAVENFGWRLEPGQHVLTITAPRFDSIFDYEDQGYSYYDVVVYNDNDYAVTVKHQVAGSSAWTTTTINAGGAVTIAYSLREDEQIAFNAYFTAQGAVSTTTYYEF